MDIIVSNNNYIDLNMSNFNLIFDNLKTQTFHNYDNILLFVSIIKFSEKLNDNFKLFDKIFSKHQYYNEKTSDYEYRRARRNINGMDKLINILIQDNSEDIKKLNDIMLQLNVMDIFKNYKHKYPNNTFNVSKIVKYDTKVDVKFNDLNCIVSKIKHAIPSCYCEINPHGEICFYCNNNLCENKCLVEEDLSNKVTPNFFNNKEITIVTKKYLYKDISKLIPKDLILELSDDICLTDYILKSLDDNTNYNEIAEVIYYLSNDKFKYDENWYEYNGIIWVISNNLDSFIMDEIIIYYKKLINLVKENLELNEQDQIYIIKTIRVITAYFSDEDIMNKIIRLTMKLSRKRHINFKNSLDNNNNVICFSNGLYKVETSKIVKHRAKDLLSMSVGYKYVRNYSEHKTDLLKFLEDILPNVEIRDYLLTYLSKCFCNKYDCGTTNYLIGKGKNGRHSLMSLIKLTFGDYFSENIDEEKKKVYYVDTNDVNNNKQVFIITNKKPDINNSKYFYFPTHFVDNVQLNHQKLINIKIEENFELWKQDFMLLLIEYYSKYKEEKLDDKVLKLPEENELIVFDFLDACTKDSDENIFGTDLYNSFEKWYGETYGSKQIIGKIKFLTEVKKKYTYLKNFNIGEKRSSGFEKLKLK